MAKLPDGSVDLMVTDPPYGYSFMGKDWDKAVPKVEVWKETLRVLKPGAFAFVMCAPRQDCLARMICNLQDAGFVTGFSSIYHTYASGFPKALNVSKAILKRFLQVSLQDVSRYPHKDGDSQSGYQHNCRLCGGLLQNGVVIFRNVSPLQDDAPKYSRLSSPSVEIPVDNGHKHKVSYADVSFHHATQDLQPLESWQTIVSSVLKSMPDDWLLQFSSDNWGLGDKFQLPQDFSRQDDICSNNKSVDLAETFFPPKHDKSGTSYGNNDKSFQSYLYYTKYCPTCQEQMSNGLPRLFGGYGGAQFKPAVEVVLVAMKPLSEKTFVDQALKNGKGVTWLDEGRIPYESEGDIVSVHGYPQQDAMGAMKGNPVSGKPQYTQPAGRFPANLLVSGDCLNDGKIQKSGKAINRNRGKRIPSIVNYANHNGIDIGYPDSGSFSRYFDLDRWFAEKTKQPFKQLPESVQKTFPFLIVAKASKSEKNKGLEGKEFTRKCRWNNAGKWQDLETKKYGNHHPTCKPLKLMCYLITLGSREGDVVLDPYMGSWTTAVACWMLKRDFLGCDNEPEYCEIGKKKIEAQKVRVI